jgi:hypothetical protein
MIDNPLQITLLDYVSMHTHDIEPSSKTPLEIFWIKLESESRPSEGQNGSNIAKGTASELTFVTPHSKQSAMVKLC